MISLPLLDLDPVQSFDAMQDMLLVVVQDNVIEEFISAE